MNSNLKLKLNEMINYEEYIKKNNYIIDENKENYIEINGNKYDNGWYSNMKNECMFKVLFNREDITSDAELTKALQKNSLKYLPNQHFVNITKSRLFKIL